MPHLTIEYSGNLREQGRFSQLCNDLARALATQSFDNKLVYPLAGIRVRAIEVDAFCIANGQVSAAFVHANLKIGAGRPEVVKQATGDALFAIMTQHFEPLDEQVDIALSLELNEFSEAGTWKKNKLHARLAAEKK